MSPPARQLRLPDLQALCPWNAAVNPSYEHVAEASSSWVLLYAQDAFKSGDRYKFFANKSGELLCAWTHPTVDPERLLTACSFVNLLYFVDQLTDVQSGREANATVAVALRAVSDDSFDDGSALCKVAGGYGLAALHESKQCELITVA